MRRAKSDVEAKFERAARRSDEKIGGGGELPGGQKIEAGLIQGLAPLVYVRNDFPGQPHRGIPPLFIAVAAKRKCAPFPRSFKAALALSKSS